MPTATSARGRSASIEGAGQPFGPYWGRSNEAPPSGHPGRSASPSSRLRAGLPPEPPHRHREPEQAPCRNHRQVAELRARRRGGGIEPRQEGVEEVANREHIGEAEDAARDLALGNEDAGEEVEGKDDDIGDRGRRLARRDE